MKKINFQFSNSKDEESPVEGKRRNLMDKFQIKTNLVKVSDIEDLITKINTYTQETTIKPELALDIFKLLDKKNQGELKINDFLSEVSNINEIGKKVSQNEQINKFFSLLNQALLTKSEKIILRLKKLRNKNWLKTDNEGLNDVNWIINVISEKNLYDLDASIITSHLKNKQKEIELAYLVKYSELEDKRQKEKDYSKIRKGSKIYKTVRLNSNKMLLKDRKKTNRRSTTLNDVISPSIISVVYEQIKYIDSPEFNIFAINDVLGKKTSIYIANEILNKFDIIENEIIPPETFKNFLETIVNNYDRKNAIYHNDLHAGDVMQTLFTIFSRGKLVDKMKLGQLDGFSILVAAICHDYKHPGTNNLYQINARTKYSLRYNDISVLENFHVAQTFKVLKKKETNIFEVLSPEEFRICRRRMIDGILATDMANHQKILTTIKLKIENYEIKEGKNFEKLFDFDEKEAGNLFEAQQNLLNMFLHSSDISNPAKPDKISSLWTERVYGEFFVQGDLEKAKNLPISAFCDRETTNINQAMIGFINFVVMPTVNILVTLINEVKDYKDYCKFNLRKHQKGLKNDESKKKLIKK